MKFLRFLGGVAIYAATTSLLVSCQKDETVSPTLPRVESTARLSGVIEDDPAIVAKVPMIMSADFLTKGIVPLQAALSARGKPDNTPPNVSISSPANASTVSGLVNVQATATDNVSVTLVSLSIDGTVIGSDNTAPYSIPWNSQTAVNGPHTIMVTARDAAGNTRSVSIQVVTNNTVAGDIVNPIVTITAPTNNSSVSGTVTVAATATDNIGVSSVSFSVDGTVLGTDNTSPFSVPWNTANTPSGIRTVNATAVDAAGNSSVNSMQVTVNTTVIPPAPLPTNYQLSMPPVADQGGEGSCVAFAVGYAAASAVKYYQINSSSYTYATNIFSPEFLYNQIKLTDCGSGTSIIRALEFIKNTGSLVWASMPYSYTNGCSLLPTGQQLTEAGYNKIASYSTVYKSDISAIKTLLFNRRPLVIMVSLDGSFPNAQPGFIWSQYSGSGGFNHALTICGYDDSKNAFKVMSSWGTGWGEGGYSWIDYNFLAQTGDIVAYVINP